MRGSFFLDTNILVYSFDKKEATKQERSRCLIREALQGRGNISWQVVQEFSNVALKGFVSPFDLVTLREYLDTVLLPLCSLFPDRDLYREAIGVQGETRFSWYDSLIVASALRLGCKTLFTEDLQHGQNIRGLTITDPFRE
jgi:predicted nucleic acid-binding protein